MLESSIHSKSNFHLCIPKLYQCTEGQAQPIQSIPPSPTEDTGRTAQTKTRSAQIIENVTTQSKATHQTMNTCPPNYRGYPFNICTRFFHGCNQQLLWHNRIVQPLLFVYRKKCSISIFPVSTGRRGLQLN